MAVREPDGRLLVGRPGVDTGDTGQLVVGTHARGPPVNPFSAAGVSGGRSYVRGPVGPSSRAAGAHSWWVLFPCAPCLPRWAQHSGPGA